MKLASVEGPVAERRWIAPQLVVLVRTHNEERVLATCKYAGIQGAAPNNVYGLCWTTEPCEHCAAWAGS